MSEPAVAAPSAPATAERWRWLWGALAALALARLAASLAPATWGWGIASLRFVPWEAWALWALAAVALVPALGRAGAPALESAGDAWTSPFRRAWPALALLAAAAAAAAWACHDGGYFVGDFALRLGSVRMSVPYSRMFPQALPLDVLLHERLVGWMHAATALDALPIERSIGLARAALLALLGVALARTLALRGAAAAAVTIATAATGALGLCTGYAKGLADLCVVVIAVGVLGLRAMRGRGGLAALGLAVAAAIALHRSGYLLLAPWAVAAWAALRGGRLATAPARLALLPPLAAAGLMLPRALTLLRGFDAPHLAGAAAGTGPALAAAFAPVHLVDAANTLAWSAPLALAALAALVARPRSTARHPDAALLAALAGPWLALVLFVHPRQGMVRDWDVFAPAGAAVAVAAAVVIGEVLRRPPAPRWLAAAVVLAAIAPVGAQMLRANDTGRSLAWARFALEQPPRRSLEERASLYQYRGIVLARDGLYRDGAGEFRHAAELIPSPARITLWLDTALLARDGASVHDALALMAERSPTPAGLLALSQICSRLGRIDEARAAARRAVELAPGDSAVVAWARRLDGAGAVAGEQLPLPPGR